MDKILLALKGIPFYQWLAVFGAVLIASAAGIEVYHTTLPPALQILAFTGGLSLWVLAWYTNEQNKNRELKRQQMDAELREKKLDAGLDPNDDKTVIKAPE